MNQRLQKLAILFCKIAFAFGALAYVFIKADIKQVVAYIEQADPYLLLASFVLLNITVLFNAARLNIYLLAENIPVKKLHALMIYFIGMFFNTVLPGGVGGDGYLTLYIRRHFGLPALKIISILLTTRANGLFSLNLFFFVFVYTSDYAELIPHIKPAIIILFLLQFPVYAIACKFLLTENTKTFAQAGIFSFLSQGLSIIAAYLVFSSLGVEAGMVDYLSLFLAASIAAIIPITPGGVGLRELVFFKGALIAGLNPQLAVACSLLYFAVYLSVSLAGLVFYIFGTKIAHHENR